ncbi:MAG: T9SS type A sorting domain-containing protein [Flavobacteriales bacterium]|nr:T9SS type A sorting domain-containing protein [Flavobacteriales bacterium]
MEPIPGWPVDTLYERIGFMRFYLDSRTWFILDMPWNGLMCYSDQYIAYTASGVEDRGLTLSASDAMNTPPARIFPNPGTNHFSLAVSPGARTIEVTDATGCVVIRHGITGDRPMVRTHQLAVGLYFVRVEGSSMPVRWMKQ